MMKYSIVILIFLCHALYSQHDDDHVRKIPVQKPSIEFVQNNGQWEEHVQFQSALPSGKLYMESGKLTYLFYRQEDLARIHKKQHENKKEITEKDLIIDAHLFQMEFIASNPDQKFTGRKLKKNYNNYFLGREKNWASHVPIFEEVFGKDLWDGIDYRLYSNDIDLKYDFIVQPGGRVSDVQIKLKHLDQIKIKHGNLYLSTSVNELIDLKPVAYQEHNGSLRAVECRYELKDNILSFKLPEGYDKNKKLIIDPQLIFSSFSGSSQDNWGFTATFDNQGNLYGGGIVFSHATRTYPTTTGAFQISQGGGGIDMGISKFNSSGTGLLFSTYIGGFRNEIPHSMVVNGNNELIIMGTTSSPDYPVTADAYDTTFNRIGSATVTVASRTFLGSDLVLTKLSSNGTSLIGSTFIGGSSFDGFNTNNLEFNYGDDVRGEVVVDAFDNTYVASTTNSTNFPVTNSSVHRGGSQEAVVFKMDSTFSNLLYSTYIGGFGNDAAYSIQVNSAGEAYVAGGTNSSNFPTTSGTIHPSSLGGIDGFVLVLNPSGNLITRSTRLGTSSYDQAYFVQLDDNNNVFVTGQTEGNYPVSPSSVYRNAFSGQFIHKLTKNLDTTVFSTVIGTGGSSGNVDIDISPSAFLVNQCNHIYLSGWGGIINSNNSQATASTTTGLPVTPGAHKNTTDGNDFYLIVLDEDADSLLYATFFGGNAAQRGEHVDGGTSRFDKKGIVYQAVCAGCGGSNSFPTAPSNVWASTNSSMNCNLGVIKFDLSQLTSDIAMSAITKVCIPGTVTFQNNSNGGNQYWWDFGDGNTSNVYQPSHTYIDTGDFTVKLVVSDSLSCILQDTAEIVIRGEGPPIAHTDTVPVICPGDSVQIKAYGGTKYQWWPSTSLSNDTIWNPMASPSSNTTYTVVVADSCGSDTSNFFAYDTAFVVVRVAPNNTNASPDDTICLGQSVTLNASGGQSYVWSPNTYLSKNNIANPISTPAKDILYSVRITDQYNCPWIRKVFIRVEDPANPNIMSHADTIICSGDSILLYSIGGINYHWTPDVFVEDPFKDTTWVKPDQSTYFIVNIGSKCYATSDTVLVEVNHFETKAMADTFACAYVPIKLYASPGERFIWTPENKLDSGTAHFKFPFASINEASTFYVSAFDSMGCEAMDSVFIDLREPPYVSAGGDQIINRPGTQLEGKGMGKFLWDPAKYLDCANCSKTNVEVPIGSHLFVLTLTDLYGCVNTDDVLITRLENDLWVPNSFTPNSDQINDVFKPVGFEITDYKLTIYNRWGQVIFITTDFDTAWDGTFEGGEAENGVYVYDIDYVQNGDEKNLKGTVSLIR